MNNYRYLLSLTVGLALLAAGLNVPVQAQEGLPAADATNSNTERPSQFEYWQYIRTDIPIHHSRESEQWFLPDKLQTFTLARTGTRYQGPGLIRFSTGPIWDLSQNFSAGILGEFVYLNPDGQTHKQEYRVVPEATFKGALDYNFNWVDRNWLEYRIFPDTSNFRYRNMARLNWKMSEHWMPYVSEEVFYDLNKGFNQNRIRFGIGYIFEPGTRLDIGYLALHRKDAQGWYLDHALTLFLFFTPPDSHSFEKGTKPEKDLPK